MVALPTLTPVSPLDASDDVRDSFTAGSNGATVLEVLKDSISGATSDTKSVAGQPFACRWRGTDGLRFYQMFQQATNGLQQHTATVAWDISTATSTFASFNIVANDATPRGMHIKPDGTKLWMAGATNGAVYAYTFGTAWLVSTLTYDSVSFSVATQDANPQGISRPRVMRVRASTLRLGWGTLTSLAIFISPMMAHGFSMPRISQAPRMSIT
jgi:hypothetical protein